MATSSTRLDGDNTDEAPTWEGPYIERDKHGRVTGARYLRCHDCCVEVLVRGRDEATHRERCRHREGRR